MSSGDEVYLFTGWKLPEVDDDARGAICTQKREAIPCYVARAFRGKRGKPDDEAARKERNAYLLVSDMRVSISEERTASECTIGYAMNISMGGYSYGYTMDRFLFFYAFTQLFWIIVYVVHCTVLLVAELYYKYNVRDV